MPNSLIHELSPYLLQHAYNPVQWMPWGDEAFAEAKRRDVPVIVSIGYSACHWCHVMERECFEDSTIAAQMNEHFVCIKVDREERPDIDHMYMDAVQAISGQGGWPLNVFVTPDGIPFYGGTYYPPVQAFSRPSWPALMERISILWKDGRQELLEQGTQLVDFIKASVNAIPGKGSNWDAGENSKALNSLYSLADREYGGFGNAPKFPGAMALQYLLDNYVFANNNVSLKIAQESLTAMMTGGIYDQAGGGFARYATDRQWLIPHFEKMLYDNALLISAYMNAYRITGNSSFLEIVSEIKTFLKREMKDASGGYYCALDADSEGVEGKFYTFTYEEWKAALGSEAEAAAAYYGIIPEGNWEDTNILYTAEEERAEKQSGSAGRAGTEEESAGRAGAEEESGRGEQIALWKQLVMQARSHRTRPATDDKLLLSWNALLHTGLCQAATNEEDIVELEQHLEAMFLCFAGASVNDISAALKAPDFKRVWKNGVSKTDALLDDFAYLCQALIQHAQATANNNTLQCAAYIMEDIIARFSTDKEDMFYFTPAGQTDIPVRKIEVYDGATPSTNAVMAHNLWILGMCFERHDWIQRAYNMMDAMAGSVARNAYAYSYWARLLQLRLHGGIKTIVIAGAGSHEVYNRFKEQYLPHAYILVAQNKNINIPLLKNKAGDEKITIFVCSGTECLPPVFTFENTLKVMLHETK